MYKRLGYSHHLPLFVAETKRSVSEQVAEVRQQGLRALLAFSENRDVFPNGNIANSLGIDFRVADYKALNLQIHHHDKGGFHVDLIGNENITINGKEYLTEHFNIKSNDENLSDEKKFEFDVWYNSENNLILKVTYNKMGNWEYRLRSFE